MTEPEPTPRAIDANALVQHVLRESYLQTTEDLRYYAEKVRYHNKLRKESRAYLGALRDFHVAVCETARERDVDIRRPDEDDSAATPRRLARFSRSPRVFA